MCNLRRMLEPHRSPRTPATVLRTRAPSYLLDSAGAEFDVVLRAVRTGCPDRLVPGPVAELLDGRAPDISELHDVAGAALRRFEAIGSI